MDKKEIYNSIVNWENEHGESFVDHFNSDIKESTFMAWCLGKCYISSDKFNKWMQSYLEEKLESKDPNYYLYDSDGGEVEFAVVTSEEWTMEAQDEAHKILAEFISEIDIYISRFNKFINS